MSKKVLGSVVGAERPGRVSCVTWSGWTTEIRSDSLKVLILEHVDGFTTVMQEGPTLQAWKLVKVLVQVQNQLSNTKRNMKAHEAILLDLDLPPFLCIFFFQGKTISHETKQHQKQNLSGLRKIGGNKKSPELSWSFIGGRHSLCILLPFPPRRTLQWERHSGGSGALCNLQKSHLHRSKVPHWCSSCASVSQDDCCWLWSVAALLCFLFG